MHNDHDKLAMFAAKVSNDINEDIDCRETRKELRQVVQYWAMDACEQRAWRKLGETSVLTHRVVITILLRFLKGDRSKAAREARRVAAIALKL